MTTKIEQAFFKAYGIEPQQIEYFNCDYGRCPTPDNPLAPGTNCTLQDKIDCEFCKIGNNVFFPTLTPARVLALGNIVIKLHGLWQAHLTHTYKKPMYLASVALCAKRIEVVAETHSDALLSLLTQLKSELSEEVQEEVKAVFG